MATIYVRSTDGSDSDNGSTWALAKATLAGAAAIDAAGDTIFVSQAHSESTASAVTIVLAGTRVAPVRLLCGNDANQPPTALETTAVIATTGASNIAVNGGVYAYGLTFRAGSGASTANITVGANTGVSSYAVYDSCAFELNNTSVSSVIRPCGDPSGATQWMDCNVKFGSASQRIEPLTSGSFVWSGGGIASGGTSPTTLMGRHRGSYARLLEALDLSQGSASMNIFTAGTDPNGGGVIRNCKLPASWVGSLASGTITAGERFELYNCDSGDTNYRLIIADYAGSILSETTIVRTGGASDGATPISWKMVSSADTEFPDIPLTSPEIARWNETTGSSITVTVEVITDNVTLKDDECWLEVQYLGTSGVPLGSFVSDAKADVLATAANQTTSSETWTTTGLTTPVKQKLSVSFTPQEKGFIHAVVKLARASTTAYVCPKLAVT